AVFISKDKFIRACCYANIMMTIVLIVALRFFFLRSYLYPAILPSIFVIALAPDFLRIARREIVIALISVLLISQIVPNTIRSIGVVLSDKTFQQTADVSLVERLKSIDTSNYTVIYSV